MRHSRSNRSSWSRPRVCSSCGQHHSQHEPHLYNYKEDVDEDLMCQICLQPFVSPIDTPCSHTFCKACLNNYIKVNPMCPIDRKPLNQMTCSPSNLVLKRLLDKIYVTCPNGDSCKEIVQRGVLDDHLRYRCSGTLVACQFASAGCDFRGPSKTMCQHQGQCSFKKEGITRLPILEGEVSHVEIPRTNAALGITIVGGADTPLRCVVVQEIFSESLIAADGRLRPGDQIIEINGFDMTNATHVQVCAALRKMSSVLRLGVYRERIDVYTSSNHQPPRPASCFSAAQSNNEEQHQERMTITIDKKLGQPLGVRLSSNCSTCGLFIVAILEGGLACTDKRILVNDRVISINGQSGDSLHSNEASLIIQNADRLILVLSHWSSLSKERLVDYDEPPNIKAVETKNSTLISSAHTRSKSEPAIQHLGDDEIGCAINELDLDEDSEEDNTETFVESHDKKKLLTVKSKSNGKLSSRITAQQKGLRICASSEEDILRKSPHEVGPLYDVPYCCPSDDYMAIYETIDRKRLELSDFRNKSHSMEALETPTPSLKSFDFSTDKEKFDASIDVCSDSNGFSGNVQQRKHRSSSKRQHGKEDECLNPSLSFHEEEMCRIKLSKPLPPVPINPRCALLPAAAAQPGYDERDGMADILKRLMRRDGPQLHQWSVSIKKNVRESLGMRIGGGIGSTEGDTPIYIANIHPHGCIGKSNKMKKGDILLSVNETSLCGLTHSQAVSTLKATINASQVTLCVMDGPETSHGASNFLPSWMYWQKMPRILQYPKTVILHRRENASWGFSIVGGTDRSEIFLEPIHVLFVVPQSPAAKDGKIRCGDHLLAVDGQPLIGVCHSKAVSMLKDTNTRIVLEVVSWMGTEV